MKFPPHPGLVAWLLLAVVLSVTVADADAVDPQAPEALLAAVAGPRLDLESAVTVEAFRLRAGVATIVLADGVIVATHPVGGRPMEFTFAGSGHIRVEPIDQVERDQVQLFTGSTTLNESFDRAVFAVTLDRAADVLASLPPVPPDRSADVAACAEVFDSWLASPERELLDVQARLFRDALGDPLGPGFFVGLFHGRRLGSFLYAVDPVAQEQVILGQFVRPELDRRDERKIARELRRAHRRGKLIGTELEDVGVWDTWTSSTLVSADGSPYAGSHGVEPTHYRIDAELDPGERTIRAVATVELTSLVDGLRALTLGIHPDLKVARVTTAEGTELSFLRTQLELTVALPESLAAGAQFAVTVEYSGTVFAKAAAKTFALDLPIDWHPRAGVYDHATYDVTLHWPAKLDLVASGSVVDTGEDPDGTRWERRRLDVPSLGFSFELGRYDRLEKQVGHVRLVVAVDKLGQKASRDLAEEILDTAWRSLVYFEEVYGPYPLDRLVVVTVPRLTSQGLLGFVTLNTVSALDWSFWGAVMGLEDRRTVVAHELAHQWWGNMVGWRSYRDQWISEAMATYSALLFARNRLDEEEDRVLRGPTSGWTAELLRETATGRPVESLGPLVVGARLNSSLSDAAYQPIVYKKGAVVLDMLSKHFGEEMFLSILKVVVEMANGKVLATRDFLTLVGRLGDVDLSWFANQFVFGTGLPEIYYSYSVEQADEGWVVAGEARQHAPYHFRYRVVLRDDGSPDVLRDAVDRVDVTRSRLVAPFQIGLKTAERNVDRGDPDRRRILKGRFVIDGETSPFRFAVEEEPEILWLDRDREVFGRFFCTSRWPRRMTYYQGLDLLAAGEYAAAEALLLEAEGAPVVDVPESWEHLEGNTEKEGRLVDAGLNLALARLYLDTDRTADAEARFELARELIHRDERWLFEEDLLCIEARLALRQWDPGHAVRLLRKKVLARAEIDSAEATALLVAAADAASDHDVLEDARELARDRGVLLGHLSVENRAAP